MLGLPFLLDLGFLALEARRLVADPASVVVGPLFGRGPLVEGLARRLPAKRTTSGVLKIVDLLHQSPGKLDPFTVMFAGRSDGLAGPVGTLIATPVRCLYSFAGGPVSDRSFTIRILGALPILQFLPEQIFSDRLLHPGNICHHCPDSLRR